MAASILEIQTALRAAGHDPGLLDGVWGRKSIAAAKSFQAAHGLTVDGIVGPKTLAVLFPGKSAVVTSDAPPVWFAELRRKMGLIETTNRSALMTWLRSDGRTLGDPSKLPWCGDAIETCIALTLPGEPMVTNPYYALNWLKFGRALTVPAIGAVLVFKRSGGGHVALYAGERSDAYLCLGGNQSNRISEAWVSKSRCVGIRWPSTVPLPTSGRVQRTAAGKLSTNEA